MYSNAAKIINFFDDIGSGDLRGGGKFTLGDGLTFEMIWFWSSLFITARPSTYIFRICQTLPK